MVKELRKHKLVINIALVILLIILAMLGINYLTNKESYSNDIENKWDGTSISSSFSVGNGTKDNPYIINNGADLAFFKQVIESEKNNEYSDKYYALGNNIDLDNHEFQSIGKVLGENDFIFKGTLDGCGYSIKNLNLTPTNSDKYAMYGLFSIIENATIKNLNILTANIKTIENDLPKKIGLIAAEVRISENETNLESEYYGNIHNISLIDIKITDETPTNTNNIIGGVLGNVSEKINISNIFLKNNFAIKNDYNQVIGYSKSDAKNIVIYDEDNNINYYNTDIIKNKPYLITKNDNTYLIKLDEQEVSSNDLLITLNKELEENYYWKWQEGLLTVEKLDQTSKSEQEKVPSYFAFGLFSAPIVLHDTGIEGNTVYINDLDSDYNYYMGLNYTDGRDSGTLPDGNNQNKYNDSNLVKIYTKYTGEDFFDNDLVGYLSLEEQVRDFIYYKYYPVIDGYVTFELIDNPYADRPNNQAFNGWVTDYPNAYITLDSDTYVRSVKIPVEDISEPISITFYANWIVATTYTMTTNSTWNNALSSIDSAGMHDATTGDPIYEDIDMRDYFIYGGTVNNRANYPTGAYDSSGRNVGGSRCSSTSWFGGTCTYYRKSAEAEYDPSVTYYSVVNGEMREFTPEIVDHGPSPYINVGDASAGFFKAITLTRGQSAAGYYDENGNYITNGTCNAYGGCTYYDYMQYYDAEGNVNYFQEGEVYYYLATRDTNIVVLRNNNATLLENTKPFTLTSVNNGNDYRNTATYTLNRTYISAGSDLRIEYVTINSGARNNNDVPTRATSTYIVGNYHNLKIGRGINTNYKTANAVLGGSNTSTGRATELTRYRLIIESGSYNTFSVSNGSSASGSAYIDGYAIYGNDYDRVANNNDNLNVYYCAAGSYAGNIYSSSQQNGVAIHTIVKSGSFGTGEYNYTSGIYVGGQNGGTHYAAREVLVEGGWIYNLLGGPLSADNRTNINDIYMNVKGGEIELIVGGAGRSETYGNRIISITGGLVNYSVFGGSNGYSGSNQSNSQGTLSGSTLIYVGGTAQIGNESNVNNNQNLYGAESGSVFGIGNGNANYTMIGTALNSNVIIDGDAKILRNVYGGGNYGAVGTYSTNHSTTNMKVLGGQINGSLYGGGNNNGSGTNNVTSDIHILMTNGTINGNLFGGSRTKGVIYGNTNINIQGGTILSDVYGGGEGGYVNNTNSGTFVTQNVNISVGTLNADNTLLTINGSLYGGSAFGTVNGSTNSNNVSNYDTSVTINSGTINTSVFGGGKGGNNAGRNYTPYVLGDVTVNINGGNIGNVFGGNDAAGSPNGIDTVYLSGGVIGNAYGGGNNTGQNATHIYLQGSTLNNLFGGSNSSGTVDESNVIVNSGNVDNIYGGNNIGGLTDKANVTVEGINISGDIYGGGSLADTNSSLVKVSAPKVNNVYGGGEQANVDKTDVTITNSTGKNIFGGSNISGEIQTSKVTIESGNLNNVYGGNNSGGSTITTNVIINDGTIVSVFGGGDNAESTTSNVEINDGNITNVFGGGNEAGLETSNVNIFGGTTTNVFGGSNNSGNLTKSNVVVGDLTRGDNINVQNVYGGNNKGGKTSSTNVDINFGNIFNVYGGGNEAPVDKTDVKITNAEIHNIYGGGNAAAVNGDTFLDIDDSILTTNVYGGGNEGIVSGNTETYITNCSIAGSAYAGGNGATAIVSGNTSITIDGKTTIGTSDSVAPHAGCIFGGGNAAATGNTNDNTSIATVNIVGATIYGNVYGGANTSVVYGKTKTNIGTKAVNMDNLVEDNINIVGTVFGGGEANASGSEIYDWNFISVTDAIDIVIDGTDYSNNNHTFLLTGSIFGSGNASSSQGTSTIYIKNLGTNDSPSRNISIQRTNDLVIDHSVIELEGIQDRTNEYSDIPYSFNQIDKLTIKNDTTLLLQRNANLLKEFYSGVDENGEVVPATVAIDDETKKVTKNVDNRIYMSPNNNLNVTTNQAATSYGKVTGMTFFGMYNSYTSGSIFYGVYDREFNYGDTATAKDAIAGGSYVLGLHSLNHDITKDGFYSNYLNDDFTEVSTAYIDPSDVGETGYRWIIGLASINYRLTLTASKYSSLGTYELSMMEFYKGGTIFEVLDFNCAGLKEGVNLIDSDLVPKVTDTREEANKLLGLTMKSETQEWTSYEATKFLSENQGVFTGSDTYLTDSLSTVPSLMFYLYHAKNISLEDELGTVVISLRALTPVNEIEYAINLVTITIDLVARNYNDADAYDASISYDKKYEMPSATSVNITNRSQFTAYYSIISYIDKMEDFYGKDNSNYHALVTNQALPVGTQITMMDFGISEDKPEYYYYTITQDIYDKSLTELDQEGEITYKLSDFIKMDSTSSDNTYDDKVANEQYYQEKFQRTIEEFLFIFDFKDVKTNDTFIEKSMLFELRNNENRAIVTVLGIRQTLMNYSLYESSNTVLEEQVKTDSEYLYHEVPTTFNIATNVSYDQTINREPIIDTNYESSAMGLNIYLIDGEGNEASSTTLLGTTVILNDETYFADSDGTWRIKLAGKVSNITTSFQIIPDTLLPAGNYTLYFVLFGSSDGLHNSSFRDAAIQSMPITVVGDNNSILVSGSDENKIVDGKTSLNETKTKVNVYQLDYKSVLDNPNIRISIMKRNTSSPSSTEYEEVDFNSLFTNDLIDPDELGYEKASDFEKNLTTNLVERQTLQFTLANNLKSGTYRVVFKLYDNNQLIEEDYEYVIVKKNLVD